MSCCRLDGFWRLIFLMERWYRNYQGDRVGESLDIILHTMNRIFLWISCLLVCLGFYASTTVFNFIYLKFYLIFLKSSNLIKCLY